MAEEVTIFVRPNENYTYKTPFQTINIIQMSEDEQDDPDPIPPGTPLLTAFSTDGTHYTNFNEIEWKPRDGNKPDTSFIISSRGFNYFNKINNPIVSVQYYYELPEHDTMYLKTKYNKIIELDGTTGQARFKFFDIKSIIPCTNEIINNTIRGDEFEKIDRIEGISTNYLLWDTENTEYDDFQFNICYIPSTDEMYFTPVTEMPLTTPKYFLNKEADYFEVGTATFSQTTGEGGDIDSSKFKIKITGASTIFNMTHD